MINKIIFLLLVSVSAVGQTIIRIPEPYGDNFVESELISEVSFIALEIERYGMVTNDMEMKVDGEDYFILDNKNTQCVYHFGSEGQLLNTICSTNTDKGTAANPILTNPVKFSVDPFNKHVEIYNFEDSKVNRFKYDGSKIDEIVLDYSPSDFIRDLEGNYWIYTGWNNSETQYRLIKANSSGSTIDRKMRLISSCTPTEGFSFYNDNENIYLWELLGSTIYSLQGEKSKPIYRLDYVSHNLPFEYHQMPADESFRMIHGIGYYSVKKFLNNDSFAYMFLNFSSTEQREMFHIIHDKKSDQVYVYLENSAIGAFDKAQAINDDNELIFLVSPRKIRQLFGNTNSFIPAPFEEITDEIRKSRNPNPVILKIKLDSFNNEPVEFESNEGVEYGN